MRQLQPLLVLWHRRMQLALRAMQPRRPLYAPPCPWLPPLRFPARSAVQVEHLQRISRGPVAVLPLPGRFAISALARRVGCPTLAKLALPTRWRNRSGKRLGPAWLRSRMGVRSWRCVRLMCIPGIGFFGICSMCASSRIHQRYSDGCSTASMRYTQLAALLALFRLCDSSSFSNLWTHSGASPAGRSAGRRTLTSSCAWPSIRLPTLVCTCCRVCVL